MAAPSSAAMPPAVGPDTIVRIKVTSLGCTYKTKLPLSDLVPSVLPVKLRALLGIADNQACVFERFSDSSSSYVNLDQSNVQAYKTLYRAAKAKLRLHLRATVGPSAARKVNFPGLDNFNQSLLSLANLNLGSASTLVVDSAEPASAVDASAVPAPLSIPVPDPPAPLVTEPLITSCIPPLPQSPPMLNSAEPKPVVQESPQTAVPKSTPEPSVDNTNSITSEKPQPVKPTVPPPRVNPERPRQYPTFTHFTASSSVRTCGNSPPMLNATYSWSVYCNNCDKNMLNEHYHCNICDDGDYDLCVECKNQGVHCRGEDHWLIKRFLDTRGSVISSTTETVGPRKPEGSTSMPGAFTEEKKSEEYEAPTRTCNCCIKAFTEEAFVTCLNCEDYDLCVPCLQKGKHGHHPAHTFEPATNFTVISTDVKALCKPGRNIAHLAVCDFCDENIFGIRYKCLSCPDWDYCSKCAGRASSIHPGHRFAPIYEQIPLQILESGPTHMSIHCDGPLCKSKGQYIRGIRYKCVVCPDVDFCASCEASPHNLHNKTHPLLKLRTPVRGCSIETVIEEHDIPRHVRAMAAASAITNAATQIRTVVDVKPTETAAKPSETAAKPSKEKIEIKDLLADPIREKISVKDLLSTAAPTAPEAKTENKEVELQAHFLRDAVADGSSFPPDTTFVQVWTLKNPGLFAWPAGCAVRYVGGDNMLNVDDTRPSCEVDVTKATESNIIRRTVQPGEEVSFRVMIKSPKRTGCAISYWRLKTADGKPFGHRLWCHINVVEPGVAATSSATDFSRDVTRLGHHDSFLRLVLKDQSQKVAAAQGMMEARKRSRNEDLKAAHELRMKHIRQELQNATQEIEQTTAQVKAYSEAIRASACVPSTSSDNEERSAKLEETPKPIQVPVPEKASSDFLVQDDIKVVVPTSSVESTSSTKGKEPIATNSAVPETVPAVAPAVPAEDDIFEDAESVNLDSSSASDGFITDEEYDILDASDQEEPSTK